MSLPDLYPYVRPLLFKMDAENAHKLALYALKLGLCPTDTTPDDARLAQAIWGLNFPNPVGVSAGFDKNAAVLDPAFGMGIGFLEAGSVTPRPQYGNPRPRLFRHVESRSVINRMGMSNEGMDVFSRRYRAFRESGKYRGRVVGVNIAKNKDTEDPNEDYLTLIDRFGPIADYLTVNVSSPNTPGLRNLQHREFLLPMLQALQERRALICGSDGPPLLLKLAPDLAPEECEEIARTVLEAGIDGLVLSNTTLDRPDTLPAYFKKETGGLSGSPVRAKSTALIAHFYKLTGGRIPLIGVGGVASGKDAYDKIRAGACLVQLYSALVFEGPCLIKRIKQDLSALLARDGFANVTAAVGADHR